MFISVGFHRYLCSSVIGGTFVNMSLITPRLLMNLYHLIYKLPNSEISSVIIRFFSFFQKRILDDS